jgi:hypothetical protein
MEHNIDDILQVVQRKYCSLLVNGNELPNNLAVFYDCQNREVIVVEIEEICAGQYSRDYENHILVDVFTKGNQDPSGLKTEEWLHIIDGDDKVMSLVLAREWMKLYLATGLDLKLKKKLKDISKK